MITLYDIFKFSEDLYYDEDKEFCPICIFRHTSDCNRCIGWDFHKEFVDVKAARAYIDKYVYPRNDREDDLI